MDSELVSSLKKKLVAKASVDELLHITGYTYFAAAASVFAAVAGAGAANRAAAAALSLRCSAGVKAQRWTRLCGNQPVCRVCLSGEEPASPRHRAGVASMTWRTTR